MERSEAETAGEAAPANPSRREWLPAAGFLLLLAVHLLTPAESQINRFAFFVGLSLLPGTLWRLSGRGSWNVHRVCFAAGLVAFVLDNPRLRPDAPTWRKIAGNWWLVTAGFLISFTQSAWGALRTHRLLADSGIAMSLPDSLRLCLSGAFFNIFLPGSTGGDAYRVYAVTRGHRAKTGAAIASITLDRLLGLPSLILVVALGLFLDYDFFRASHVLSGLGPFIAATGAACLILVAYLAWAGRTGRSPGEDSAREDGGGPPGWIRRTHAIIAANVKRPATLPLALFYGFMSHAACIASCGYFGLALGVEGVPALRYCLIVPMAMTINAIPGAPGGIGQGELAMATLLDLASPGAGNAQEGVMIMLLFRLSNMAMGIAGGALHALGQTDSGGGKERCP